MTDADFVDGNDRDEPLYAAASAAREAPWMFAVLAVPLVERFGEDGKALISDTRYQEGFKLGEELAAKAKDRNDLREFEQLRIEHYNKDYQFTPNYDDPNREWKVQTAGKCSFTNRLTGGCEVDIPAAWSDMGLDAEQVEMLGDLYCRSYELGLRKGFNPNIEFKLEKLLPAGDPYCLFTEEISET